MAVSQRASALIGSVGSMWMRATIPFMHRFHGEPVTVCSLRDVRYRTNGMYVPTRQALYSEQCDSKPPECVRRPSMGFDDPPEREFGLAKTHSPMHERGHLSAAQRAWGD